MINRIKTHNILNGIIFSIVKFIIALFAIYYVVHTRVLYATIAIGIILNCLMIVMLGLQQYKGKEKMIGLQHMFDRNVWERVNREYPHRSADTSVLDMTLILPFVMSIWVIIELLSNGPPRGEKTL